MVEEDMEEKEENLEDPKEPEGESPEGEEPKELEGFDELMNKSVEEITAIAKEKNLNAKDYLTKDELAKAILEVEKAEEKTE